MKLTIYQIIDRLRTFEWDNMLMYLSNDYLPGVVKDIETADESKMGLLNDCIELINVAIENQDIILLCDILEYELWPLLNKSI
ncbi:MAG: hypothetical protein ACQEWE_13215 [Bacillota bacterium]